MKNIAIIGAGYWGKNLVRNFFQLEVLKTVCEQDNNIRSMKFQANMDSQSAMSKRWTA